MNLELKSFCLLKTLEKQKEAHMSKVVKLYTAMPVIRYIANLARSALFWNKPRHGQTHISDHSALFSESFTMMRNVTHVPHYNTLRKGSRVIHCDGIDNSVSIAGRRTCGGTGPLLNGAPPTVTWPSSPR